VRTVTLAKRYEGRGCEGAIFCLPLCDFFLADVAGPEGMGGGGGGGQTWPMPASQYPSPNFAEFSSCNSLYQRSAHSRPERKEYSYTRVPLGLIGNQAGGALFLSPQEPNQRPTRVPGG